MNTHPQYLLFAVSYQLEQIDEDVDKVHVEVKRTHDACSITVLANYSMVCFLDLLHVVCGEAHKYQHTDGTAGHLQSTAL